MPKTKKTKNQSKSQKTAEKGIIEEKSLKNRPKDQPQGSKV